MILVMQNKFRFIQYLGINVFELTCEIFGVLPNVERKVKCNNMLVFKAVKF